MINYEKISEKLVEKFLFSEINFSRFEKIGNYLEKRAGKKLFGTL